MPLVARGGSPRREVPFVAQPESFSVDEFFLSIQQAFEDVQNDVPHVFEPTCTPSFGSTCSKPLGVSHMVLRSVLASLSLLHNEHSDDAELCKRLAEQLDPTGTGFIRCTAFLAFFSKALIIRGPGSSSACAVQALDRHQARACLWEAVSRSSGRRRQAWHVAAESDRASPKQSCSEGDQGQEHRQPVVEAGGSGPGGDQSGNRRQEGSTSTTAATGLPARTALSPQASPSAGAGQDRVQTPTKSASSRPEVVASSAKRRGRPTSTPPASRNAIATQLASPTLAAIEAELQAIRDREELKDCTFRPHLISRSRRARPRKGEAPTSKAAAATGAGVGPAGATVAASGAARGSSHSPRRQQDAYNSCIERMRTAWRHKEELREVMEHVPSGENYERLRKLPVNPFSCYYHPRGSARSSSARRKEQLLMYVDVNIGNGRTGRIGIHTGDDLRTLAQNFAKIFQLDRNSVLQLERLLRDACAATLPWHAPVFEQQEQEEDAQSEWSPAGASRKRQLDFSPSPRDRGCFRVHGVSNDHFDM